MPAIHLILFCVGLVEYPFFRTTLWFTFHSCMYYTVWCSVGLRCVVPELYIIGWMLRVRIVIVVYVVYRYIYFLDCICVFYLGAYRLLHTLHIIVFHYNSIYIKLYCCIPTARKTINIMQLAYSTNLYYNIFYHHHVARILLTRYIR